MYDFDLCKQADSDNPCYEPGNDNVASVADGDGAFVIDPFFSPSNRSELEDNEGGESVSPGSELWGRISKKGNPMLGADFDFSDLVEDECAVGNVHARDQLLRGPERRRDSAPQSTSATSVRVCEYPNPDDLVSATDRARHRRHRVRRRGRRNDRRGDERSSSARCAATRATSSPRISRVWRHDRLGPIRWSVALPTPAALEATANVNSTTVRCEFTFTVEPQADGSVRVTETTSVITNGVDESSLEYTITDPNLGNLGVNLYRDCCGAP